MVAYYNEIDPFAAQWLRNLIAAGHIAPGEVDERSIEDVRPDEIAAYTQCHFFAGIGVWSHGLRLAGWPDSRPAWTASCPCQPFSAAGKGAGFADERHLWPALHHLIRERRPPVVFGEQVEGRDGLAWLDLVQPDMEDLDYACGAVVAPAAGFGAPHLRHRTYWVAHSSGEGWGQTGRDAVGDREANGGRAGDRPRDAGAHVQSGGLAYAGGECLRGESGEGVGAPQTTERDTRQRERGGKYAGGVCALGRMGDAESDGRERRQDDGDQGRRQRPLGQAGETNGFWRDADWLYCRDDKWRPVEPGAFPLVDGVAGRVGRLRAYGNAIVAPQAAAFIEAAMEHIP